MKRLTFIGLIASLVLCGCNEEMVGPSIEGIAIDKFNIVGSSEEVPADFQNGDIVRFVGSWECDAKWIIQIHGQTSGATKTLKGYGKSLDESVVWDGSADLVFFKPGETCEATLSFENYNDSLVAKNFVKVIKPKAIEGIVLSDFDGVEVEWEGWNSTSPVIEDGVALPPTQKMSFADENIQAPQGDHYMQISGYEGGGQYYLSGHNLVLVESPLQLEPENIKSYYLNFFAYGYPEYYSNSTINVLFTDENGNEIAYDDHFKIAREGWNGISISMAKFKGSKNETGIPFDYTKITEAAYSLFSLDGTECAAKAGVDYFIITKGKPLFPLYN